jgi:hypothetical protein
VTGQTGIQHTGPTGRTGRTGPTGQQAPYSLDTVTLTNNSGFDTPFDMVANTGKNPAQYPRAWIQGYSLQNIFEGSDVNIRIGRLEIVNTGSEWQAQCTLIPLNGSTIDEATTTVSIQYYVQ